jgi:hypothetical protein
LLRGGGSLPLALPLPLPLPLPQQQQQREGQQKELGKRSKNSKGEECVELEEASLHLSRIL